MKRQKRPQDKEPKKTGILPLYPVSVVPGCIHWGTSKNPVSMDYPLPCHPAPGTKFHELYGKSRNEMCPFLKELASVLH